MTLEKTRYEVDEEGVALIQLDRPKALNAIDTEMIRELLVHLEAAREDGNVRVLVMSSTDHMAFSAGADIREDLDRAGKVERMVGMQVVFW